MGITVKKFLQQFEVANTELDTLLEEHDRIVSRLMSMTQSYDGDGGGGSRSPDPMGDGVAALVDLCGRIDAKAKRYIAVRDSVRSVVRAVMRANITMGQSLHYRYIDCDKAATVAYRMGYDERQERRIHQAALRAAAEAMEGMGMTGEWLEKNVFF